MRPFCSAVILRLIENIGYSPIPLSHWLYRFLEGKKTSRFQFSVPGLREIHRNLKQQKKFKSRDGFFRKSPFCTFSCINPGFGEPWGMLWIFFLIGIFIMLQKNTFGQKKFKFHAPVQKCHFGNFSIFPKWHFWTGAWNLKFFLTKSILLKHYEYANKKKYS